MTFCGGVDWSLLLHMVCLVGVGYLYISRDARHDFNLVRVRPEANAFKEDDKDVHCTVQPDMIPQSNQPVVNKESNNLSARLSKYPASGLFFNCPTKPLPYCINTNIKH
jgi:hypothetical protein